MQVIQQHIAVVIVIVVVRSGAILKQDVAAHAQLRRKGCGLAGVVGLRGTLGHHHFGALQFGLGHQEFKFAGLVATGGQTGAIIAFDPDFGPAQFFFAGGPSAQAGLAGVR